MARVTQRDMVLQYLREFGSITSWDAYKDLGITQLATRISELKDQGYEFSTEYEHGKTRFGKNTAWVRYRLREVS